VKLPRRKYLHLATGAAVLLALPRIVRAQAYPARPIRLIVPFPAGGTGDVLARFLGQALSERLGQPFIIDNRPGAGTNIGVEAVVRAQPDGYTLLLVTAANAINATLYEKLSFNFIRDIVPVANVVRIPLVMEVNPSVPARTVAEFTTYAKLNPGTVAMASGGIGIPSHVAGELYKMMTGTDLIHVPYRGEAPALTDLIGGRVQVMFPQISSVVEYNKAGSLRALGVTTATRLDMAFDIPTVAESVPGYEASSWSGIGAPHGTPADIVEKLNKSINGALADPAIKARLTDLGGTLLPGSAADFGKFLTAETEKWGKVIRAANIKPE
jgi:tripartite-type tricarboxylate transporter receptor subunit TctC